MTLVHVITRPTTVLLLISIVYTIVAVPADRRLEVLALTGMTSLGAGELMVTLVHLIRRQALRVWLPTALLSAAGFAGSVSYLSNHSTVLFIASMLLLVSGVLAARSAVNSVD